WPGRLSVFGTGVIRQPGPYTMIRTCALVAAFVRSPVFTVTVNESVTASPARRPLAESERTARPAATHAAARIPTATRRSNRWGISGEGTLAFGIKRPLNK